MPVEASASHSLDTITLADVILYDITIRERKSLMEQVWGTCLNHRVRGSERESFGPEIYHYHQIGMSQLTKYTKIYDMRRLQTVGHYRIARGNWTICTTKFSGFMAWTPIYFKIYIMQSIWITGVRSGFMPQLWFNILRTRRSSSTVPNGRGYL